MELHLDAVTVTYRRGSRETRALDGVDLHVARGEFVTVRGPSGSGKSTLLMLCGGMQRPTAGRVRVDGDDLYAGPPARRVHYRRTQVGFVFQSFHLLPYLDLIDNLRLAGGGRAGDRAAARALLDEVGLGDRADHHPGELSAGERQRAAVARALLHEPALLLADEPTGNLDEPNAQAVLELLRRARDARGTTVLLVTHGALGDAVADRVTHLDGGRLQAAAATPTAR